MTPQPFIPMADGAQVEILCELFGKIVENRLWFVSRQPPIDSTQLQALANGVASWHIAQVLPHLSHDLILATVVATRWEVADDIFEVSATSPVTGGSLVDAHSANVSVRVRFTPSNDVRYTNANFVPGIPLDQVDGNVVNSGLKSALFDAYVSLIDLAPLFGPFPAWTWVCASRILDGSYRTELRAARTDFIHVPSPYVSPRRKRLP